MRLIVFVVLLSGCVGSHPSDRDLVADCETAFASGQHGDPCLFEGECGTAERDPATRSGAVCDNGTLLLARIVERLEDGTAPCAGVRDEASDAFVSFRPMGSGCVEVTFCNETLGGGAGLRVADLCQIGASVAAVPGATFAECPSAVRDGVDGDPCIGSFGCFADRSIAPGDILPVVVWCDAGVLRLAPSQTLIFGGR